MFEKYIKLTNGIDKLVYVLLVIFAAIMTVAVTVNVFFRYVLGSPLVGPEAAARYLMIAITFFASSTAFKHREHAKLTFVVERLPSPVSFVLKLLTDVIVIVFLIYVFRESLNLALIEGPRQVSHSLGIPMTYAFISMPIGAILMIMQIIRNIAEDIVYYKKHGKSLEFQKGTFEEEIEKEIKAEKDKLNI